MHQESTDAKVRAMEELWDDLCRTAGGIASPAWHGEVLAKRLERLERGETKFLPWQEVQERLLRKN
jgi:hypothetical protein